MAAQGIGRAWCFTCFDVDWLPPVSDSIRYLIMQLEQCPDTGRMHWQGYVELSRASRMQGCKTLLACPTAHLSLRKGSREEARDYCLKEESRADPEGLPYIQGDWDLGGQGTRTDRKREAEAYAEAWKPEVTVAEARALLIRECPRDMALYGDRIEANLKVGKRPRIEWVPRYSETQWLLPVPMQTWLAEELPKTERARCLVVVGPTRLGKTEWARHIFPREHMYCRGIFNLDKWDPTAKVLILDDLEWKYIPQKKTLLTQMGESEFTDKYRSKRTINVTMPAIVLCNTIPEFDEVRYWVENTTVVEINSRLY